MNVPEPACSKETCAIANIKNSLCFWGHKTKASSLCDLKRERTFARGEELPSRIAETDIAIVKRGVVAAMTTLPNGKTQGLFIANRGCALNLINLAGDTRNYSRDFNSNHSAYVLSETLLCFIPLDAARNEFRSNDDFAFAILSETIDRYKDVLANMEATAEKPGIERIKWLLSKVQNAGADPAGLTHELIARLLGMNRVSVSRLMGEIVKGY